MLKIENDLNNSIDMMSQNTPCNNNKPIPALRSRNMTVDTKKRIKRESTFREIGGGSSEMGIQLQTLMEENNQLKLEKKVLEGKYQQVKKKLEETRLKNIESQVPKNEGQVSGNDNKMIVELLKSEVESKNEAIRELEFQLSSIQSEDHLLRVTNELQKSELEKLGDELGEKDELEEMLEEANEQIEDLNLQVERDEEKLIYMQRIFKLYQFKAFSQLMGFSSFNGFFFDFYR